LIGGLVVIKLKTPRTNFQAPENHQTSNKPGPARWAMVFGCPLELGAWGFHYSNALGPVGAVTVFSAGLGFLGFDPRNV
jgi:hypothetical protein